MKPPHHTNQFVALLIACFVSHTAGADEKTILPATTSAPAGLEQPKQDPKTLQPICTPQSMEPRCRPVRPRYDERTPYGTRPVIINSQPAPASIDLNNLTDSWADCRRAKLAAISARDNGDVDQANRLEEWLWKNCRGYSNELRQLE